MARRFLLAAAVLVTGCVRTSGNVLTSIDGGTCRGLPCSGCCDTNGVCQPGDLSKACGARGAACGVCTASQACQSGGCVDVDAGPVVCRPCLTGLDCGLGADCVQYGNSDYCGVLCFAELDCPPGQTCTPTISFNGNVEQVCAPSNGGCGGSQGCGTCDAGTTCDVTTATCVPVQDGGVPVPDGGSCGALVSPGTSSCCHSCTPGTGDCQPNGCYGGWWCNTSGGTSCHCVPPPTSCGDGGSPTDGGVVFDGGPPTGTVGPGGGTVSRLYFAVVGDTRPANIDDTANYPTAVITKIFQEIAALNPPVQFVLSTGDYQFAYADGGQGQEQIELYVSAARTFTHGPMFSVMGNQECTGLTESNCPAGTTGNNTLSAFMSSLVFPLGKTSPYYVVNFNAQDGTWTAKLVIIACNAWDAAQKAWFVDALGHPTTYTLIARHEPPGSNDAPCIADVDPIVNATNYNAYLAGHIHSYSHAGKALRVGNGGAPSTSDYGFVTIEQQPGFGFKVTAFDYSTAQPVDTWYFQ